MIYIEPPEIFNGDGKSLFLAGSIRGAPDWQHELAAILKDENVTLLNPRRKDFPADTPDAAMEQTQWEFQHLRKASAISFWFAKETALTMTLYELGAWSMMDKPIFVGVDPDYARRADIEMQTKLARPDVKIAYSIDDIAGQIKEWIGWPGEK